MYCQVVSVGSGQEWKQTPEVGCNSWIDSRLSPNQIKLSNPFYHQIPTLYVKVQPVYICGIYWFIHYHCESYYRVHTNFMILFLWLFVTFTTKKILIFMTTTWIIYWFSWLNISYKKINDLKFHWWLCATASVKQGAWYVNIAKITINLIYGLRPIASCKVTNYKRGVWNPAK